MIENLKTIVELQREDRELWVDPANLDSVEALRELALNLQSDLTALHLLIDKQAAGQGPACKEGACEL